MRQRTFPAMFVASSGPAIPESNLREKRKNLMYSLIQLKITLALLITLTLLCIGFLPGTQAVVPPPDGGYPDGNTAEGQNALFRLTTGGYNTAVGWYSLFGNTTANYNTAVGAGALDLNTCDNKTATGAAALLLNTTGH